MSTLVKRLSTVKPSASAMISQTARQLKNQGRDIIDLGMGEPDFDTPPHIIEAAHQAALDGQTRYTPTVGTIQLRRAIQNKFRNENTLDYGLDELIVCNGAKQVIFNALMATVEAGDEVILCAPYFDSYRNMVNLLGGVKRTIVGQPGQRFCIQPEALENAITPKTRWLIVNSPSNPAGARYHKQQLAELGSVLQRHPHVLVLSDEIYEHIIFDDQDHVGFLNACPGLAARVLTVNGVSKAYAMTGWRIGYAGGPSWLINAMVTVQSQISSGVCAISQAAATAALEGPQDSVSDFRKAFETRRNIVVQAIDAHPDLSLVTPAGAFYALINCEAWLSRTTATGRVLNSDADVASALLEEVGISSVPGGEYELPGYFRLSTACSESELHAALQRLFKWSETLS